jgi:ATP-binding cassette subfamily B protein
MLLPSLLQGKRKRLFFSLVANSGGQTIATIAVAALVQNIFDGFVNNKVSEPATLLIVVGGSLVAMALVTAWLRKTEYALAENLGQEYIEAIRLTLFDCLQNTAVRTLQRRARGATLLRFVGDLNSIRRWVSLGLSRIVVASIIATGAMIALAVLQWEFAIVAGSIIAIGTWLMIAQGKKMREAVQETRRRRSHLATNISEKIASLAVVQVFGRAQHERNRLTRQSKRLKKAVVRQAAITGQLRGISEATISLASTAVLLIGVYELHVGNCSPGTVVAAMGIIGLLRSPIGNLARVYEYRQSAFVARQKLEDFLAMPPFVDEESGTPILKAGPGLLEFCDVSVESGLKNFSAQVEPGQVVALVGPNGAGKTTLLAAAARLTHLDSGEIYLDSQDLAKHNLDSVHQAISMLSPDLPLMRGSIEANLRYRCPDASEDELQRVVKLCGIDEITDTLPEGLKTRIVEGGANLSPGQRQRISIARAILGGPSILLLDEADENLDPVSTKILDRVLNAQSATVLIVTHRL